MRYELVEETEGTFTVWDRHTRKPADAWGTPAVGLTKEYAVDLQALLESLYLRRRLYGGT
jgi:hypothetical protein